MSQKKTIRDLTLVDIAIGITIFAAVASSAIFAVSAAKGTADRGEFSTAVGTMVVTAAVVWSIALIGHLRTKRAQG